MPSLLRFRWPLLLRAMALGLLVFGLAMNPVIAAACDIDDASQALAGVQQPVAAQDEGAGADCCQVQACSACCTHGVAMLPSMKLATAPSRLAGPRPVLSVEFEPTAYPVAFRPPIRR